MAFSSTPPENPEKPIDFFNPLEVAALGAKKSIDGLVTLLALKKEGMKSLEPQNERDREVLNVTNDSVSKRLELVEGIRAAA